MDAARRFFFGPTPEEQKRKCNSIIRANTHTLDREMQNLRRQETKARGYIREASIRAKKTPSQTEDAAQESRVFARELLRVRRQQQRVATSRATMASVQMQVNEAFAMKRIEGSIKSSTSIMKDINMLVNMRELTGTMRELSQELVKAGIIEEMVGDSLPNGEGVLEGEDEAAETEIDKVLSEVLKDKVSAPDVRVPEQKVEPLPQQPEEEEIGSEEMLAQMRGRLEALKS